MQNLRLTVAEAQFASQFNGVRSVQQIAKNLRLDLKFARLTLFRFLALEIIECWPPTAAAKPESGVCSAGFGDLLVNSLASRVGYDAIENATNFARARAKQNRCAARCGGTSPALAFLRAGKFH